MCLNIGYTANLKRQGTPPQVSMSSSNMNDPVLGKVCCNITIQDRNYCDVSFTIISGLCAVILGQNFFKRHKQIIVQINGSQENLIVSNNATQCTASASSVEPRRLLQNLSSDCRAIAIKSRNFSEEDKQFIRTEMSKLLNKVTMEKSCLPWRAQVFVLQDEKHNPRMVVDYSHTVHKYTLLNAYPLPNTDKKVRDIAKVTIFSSIILKSVCYQAPLTRTAWVKLNRFRTGVRRCGLYMHK